MKITILGNGVFSSVIASYLNKIGHEVFINEINNSEIIFICTTSNIILDSLLKLKEQIINQKIVICSKGFVEKGLFISEVLKENFKNDIFFLYGPTLADELGKDILSGMILAGPNGKEEIKKEIESESLYIELSDDVIGVEISATFKNIMAIFIGIVLGAELGQNTTALVFTKCVQEVKDIGISLGAKEETFLSLVCVGDLFLSSRNRLLGVELGKGRKLNDIVAEMNYTPAGIFDIKNAKIMSERLNIKMPFIELLYQIIFENYSLENLKKEIIKICLLD